MACKLCNDTKFIIERGMVYTQRKTCELCSESKKDTSLDMIADGHPQEKKRGRPKREVANA